MTERDPSVEFRVGMSSAPSGLDPRTANDAASHTLLRQIFEPPMVIRRGNVEPLLFTERLRKDPSDPARPVYSAQVRSDLRFSDGTPLTAEIMARSLSKTRPLAEKASVAAEGDRVVFKLHKPEPRFDLLLTQTYCGIVHEKAGGLVGTGAFVFERPADLRTLSTSTVIRLVRNPHFGRKPSMQSLAFVIYPLDADGTPTELLEACGRGDIDFTASLTSLHAAKVPVGVVYPAIQNGVSTAYLTFNTDSPALADRRVRKAMALALDKNAIVKTSFEKNPLAFVAKDILPPALDAQETDLYPSNPAEAARLFNDGVPKPNTPLKLLVIWSPRPYAPNPTRIAAEVKRQYEALGIRVELKHPKGSADYYSDLAAGRYDLVFSGWIPDSPDPADTYESLLSSEMIQKSGGSNASAFNLSRIRNAELDRAIAAFRADPSALRKKDLLRIVQEEVPLIPLMKGQAVVVLARRVRNFEHSLDGVYAFEDLVITK